MLSSDHKVLRLTVIALNNFIQIKPLPSCKTIWINTLFNKSFNHRSYLNISFTLVLGFQAEVLAQGRRNSGRHKRMAWGCRGCRRIPNAEKLAIIRTKIFKIWAKYKATFACEEESIFQTETK